MRVVSTIKSFDEYKLGMYDFLIPMIPSVFEELVQKIIVMDDNKINIDGLDTIHFTENYREELYSFQKSIGQKPFATLNQIGEGQAQVVTVKKHQERMGENGYHIFFNKMIAAAVLISQWLQDRETVDKGNEELSELVKLFITQKNVYIRMIRHELCHIEDQNNRKDWTWLDSSFTEKNLQTILRSDSFRLWEEYYACKRSNFIYSAEVASEELKNAVSNMDIAEREICELRWKYNNLEIELEDFVNQLHDYIRTTFIYWCYYMGHMDKYYESLVDRMMPELYPSRFYHFLPDIWKVLHAMSETYPEWQGPEIYDDLAKLVLQCINEFKVFPKDTATGLYYGIPVVHLQASCESGDINKKTSS